jgi:type I restriction enzyme S subunit
MTTAQFFEKFDLIADAPDAVAKMRSLILELAGRGQLTSASRQPSASSDPSANPFPIPQDWRWVALREVAAPCGQKKPDARFTYIDVGAIDNQRGVISTKAEVVEAAKAPSRARKIVRSGCVVYATVRPYLRNIAIVTREFDPPAIASTAFAVLMPEKVLDAQFLFYWLRCASFQDIVSSKMKGVAYPAISDTEFWQCPIPLPPLAEQKRIVAKVDELMALCDQLETQRQERETKHTALAQATLARFAEAPTPTNLKLLFHSSFSIQPSDLRKTILTLAVQGKLVPSNKKRHVVLGDVIQLISGQHLLAHEHNAEGKGIPYLTGPSDFGLKSPVATRWTETPKVVAEPGDILITVKGSGVGKTNKLISERTAISRQLMAVRATGADPDFVHLVLINAAAHFQDSMTGIAIPGIGRKDVLQLEAELPPLAEQKRIVAKVEELMALVDALEAQQAAADQAATHLLDAVVSELAAAA